MPMLRVHNFTISLDGYGAGPDQSVENPLGVGGERLHDWVVATRAFRETHGQKGGEEGSIDDNFAARQFENVGAWIMGRNMFGPVRRPWPDESWRGWWGEDPPFHNPVFVLTHHPRLPLAMQGGTTFHFVTDGIESALERAFEAAGGQDVLVGGGASTIQQYLRAGLIDEMHYAIAPLLLGAGERLFDNLDGGQRKLRVRRAGQLARRGARPAGPNAQLAARPGWTRSMTRRRWRSISAHYANVPRQLY